MNAKVVDASVFAALVFGEPRADEARGHLRRRALFAPTLLHYELASIARKKTIQQPDAADKIVHALRLGLSLNVTLLEPDHAAVLELALAANLSSYDASYLAVARFLRIPLITFDVRLDQAAKQFI